MRSISRYLIYPKFGSYDMYQLRLDLTVGTYYLPMHGHLLYQNAAIFVAVDH